jgi:hypothetical protein
MTHPDMSQLTAFGHGRLPEAEVEKIADHLAECETCQKFLDDLPDDALLAFIRPLFTHGPQQRALPADRRKRAAVTKRPT